MSPTEKTCGCGSKPSHCIVCTASRSNNDVKLKFKAFFKKTVTPTILSKIDSILSASSLTPTQQKLSKIAITNSINQIAPIIYCNFYDIALKLPSDQQLSFFTGLLLNLRANMITTLVDFKLKQIYDDNCLTLEIKETIVSTWMTLINGYAKKLFLNSNC